MLERLLKRPLVRALLEEYLVEHSPLVRRYAERVAEVTGLPLEVVKRSRPVRNYARRILGDLG
jgi:DNA mismatch repair ATPase MutS